MTLSYKQLQSALKELREQGLTSIKLNAKQSVLQEEYDRLNATATTLEGQCTELTCEVTTVTSTRPHILTSEYNAPAIQGRGTGSIRNERHSKLNDSYPFCSNAVTVLNRPTLPTLQQEQELATRDVITRTLPAMNKKYAPSWLCKPETLYIVDGVDYLIHELEMQLKGQVCEIACAWEGRGSDSSRTECHSSHQPALQDSFSSSNKQEETSPVQQYNQRLIDNIKHSYLKTLGSTELQALRNAENGIRYTSSAAKRGIGAVIGICQGFHKAQVERALKAGALAA